MPGNAAPPAGPRPDFFIVGAFKCGTTAMYEYLRQHPQVFMPFHKEPLFFGDDLTRRYGRMSLDEYLALFRDASHGQRIGEASSWYLYSNSAAREIKRFAPAAQIIVMLRNPVDVMYAQHSQLVFSAAEDLVDFGKALEAEPARRRGERLPPGPIRLENLFYRESVRFADQLERYMQVFGPDRVHTVIYDDFESDTLGAYRSVLDFLGVDPEFRPEFEIVNQNKVLRSPTLQRLIYQPPSRLLPMARFLRRFPFVHRLRSMAAQINSRRRPRRPMDADLRSRLLADVRTEVERLGTLVGRDLSAWLER